MTMAFKTLDRHIIEQQRRYPHASGKFTELLLHITIAAKMISYEVNKAGLAQILGQTGEQNVYGEQVQKLDIFANRKFFDALDHTGLLCAMASEESQDYIAIPDKYPCGPYVRLLFHDIFVRITLYFVHEKAGIIIFSQQKLVQQFKI